MRVSNHIKLAMALGLVAMLVLSGCGQPASSPTTNSPGTTPPTSTGTPTSTPTATAVKPTGELRVAFSNLQEERFDPVRTTSSNAAMLDAPVFDTLLRLNGPNLAPGLAEKWEMAPDGLSWIYTIRKGIKFHNGEDMNADDVKLSLERYAGKDAQLSYVRDMVDRVEKVDDYTVRVYTKGTQPYLPYMNGQYSPTQGMVQPKDYIDQRGIDYLDRNPVGTGPFKFVRHVPGDMVEYEAVDSHWRQVPAFKKLAFIVIPEDSTRVAAMKTGGIDITEVGLEEAADLERGGFRTVNLINAHAGVYLYGNYDSRAAGKPTTDIRVRQALSLAIDRQEVIDSFFNGKAVMPWPPYINANSSDVDPNSWKEYGANLYKYDPEQAKKLLKDAGAEGMNLKLYAYEMGDAPYLMKLAEVIQGYWLKIGVKAEIVPTDWGTFRRLRNTGEDRAPATEIVGQASLGAATDEPVAPTRLSVGFMSKGTVNLLGNAMPNVDKLISGAQSDMDPAKRKELLDQAIKITAETYTMLPIASVPYMAAVGPNVELDFNVPTPAIALFIDQAKHKK